MVTDKESALRIREGKLLEQTEALEEVIEEKIEAGHVYISLGIMDLPKNVTYDALGIVADKYRAVGWQVDYRDDQRDGMYIVLR